MSFSRQIPSFGSDYKIKKLENKLKIFTDSKHCIGVSSGTDALLLALMALNINEGDEVITTSFSFFATAEVIALLKAKPIFIDVDLDTMGLSPTALKIFLENFAQRKQMELTISYRERGYPHVYPCTLLVFHVG